MLLLLFVRGVVSTTRTSRFWPPVDPHGFAVVVLSDVRVPVAVVSVVGVMPTFDDGVGGVVAVGIPIGGGVVVAVVVAVVVLTLTRHLFYACACRCCCATRAFCGVSYVTRYFFVCTRGAHF